MNLMQYIKSLGLEVDLTADRPIRIINHYQAQLDRGRMEYITATERALADISRSNNGKVRI